MTHPAAGCERMVAALVFAAGLLGSGCESSTTPRPDGGVGRRLEIVQMPGAPPAGQIGLRYEQSANLVVRYVLEDPDETPVSGEPVRFAIFGDPAGSTLARDVVNTQDDGTANVTLTAGAQEGSFLVRASAPGANDVEVSVSVSILEFVQILASVTDPLPGAGTHKITAALYSQTKCGALSATPTLTGSPRVLVEDATASAQLEFVNLLSRDYAVVARVNAGDQLLAYGCVDVDRNLASPGANLNVPVSVRTVTPSVLGRFSIVSQVGTSRDARSDNVWGSVNVLDRCSGHLAQLVLDELASRIGSSRGALLESQRGPSVATTVGGSTIACRTAVAGGMPSIDVDLNTLFNATPMGAARAALVTDLDDLIASGELTSHLDLVATTALPTDGPGSPARLLGNHTAETVRLRVSSTSHDYDLSALGWPSPTTLGIAADTNMTTLDLARHELAVDLPTLWRLGFSDLSLRVRLPSLANATFGGWVTATVAAAQRNGKTGCAAIENLVCERTDPTGCAGTLIDACNAAVLAAGTRLDIAFDQSPVLGLDGTASVFDDDGDLVADRLSFGSWNASGAIEARISFSAERMQQ